jgi:hypothetical protein
MPLAVWLLGACWRPEPWTPPPVPDEAAEALADEGSEAKAPDGATDEAGAREGAADATESGAAESGDAPADDTPETPAIQPYKARILRKPATLVDDAGKPVALVTEAGTEVEVRAIEPLRARVSCPTCRPAAEGWIQLELVDPPAPPAAAHGPDRPRQGSAPG